MGGILCLSRDRGRQDPVTVAVVIGHSTPQMALTTYFHYFHEARIKAGNAIANVLLDRKDDEKTAV